MLLGQLLPRGKGQLVHGLVGWRLFGKTADGQTIDNENIPLSVLMSFLI